MELIRPQSYEKIVHLISKGVDIPNPLTLDIGPDVNLDQISGKGVKIYPGCRIYGAKVVVSAGARLGAEGPVTVEDCQLGPNVELKAGYFSKSVFLDKANMGLGAHVREGCILEEEAGGAHCVGLKQTILFPFVTLGSLVNFCDCLMAGGTSRKNHSEVGSSYIHFNFTPDGDKTTPSLIGDVPRGVVLNQPPIFLGGQGGIVGPVRMGYGNVVAAGSILRSDYLADNKLIIGKSYSGGIRDFIPASYPGLARIVENNVVYLANLAALEQWYLHVRKGFLEAEEFGQWPKRRQIPSRGVRRNKDPLQGGSSLKASSVFRVCLIEGQGQPLKP
jgi:UDP-N-acetylglucosamine/UDP-N-acetylgalactosamine diphosphorylase